MSACILFFKLTIFIVCKIKEKKKILFLLGRFVHIFTVAAAAAVRFQFEQSEYFSVLVGFVLSFSVFASLIYCLIKLLQQLDGPIVLEARKNVH